MSILPRDCQNAEVPLSRVLQQTGTCLTQLSGKILAMEHEIWGAHTPIGEPAVQANALQALDFLKQATDDLAALLERLGESVPPALSVSEFDVIAPMKLETLRQIVSTNANTLKTSNQRTTHEEVELF